MCFPTSSYPARHTLKLTRSAYSRRVSRLAIAAARLVNSQGSKAEGSGWAAAAVDARETLSCDAAWDGGSDRRLLRALPPPPPALLLLLLLAWAPLRCLWRVSGSVKPSPGGPCCVSWVQRKAGCSSPSYHCSSAACCWCSGGPCLRLPILPFSPWLPGAGWLGLSCMRREAAMSTLPLGLMAPLHRVPCVCIAS